MAFEFERINELYHFLRAVTDDCKVEPDGATFEDGIIALLFATPFWNPHELARSARLSALRLGISIGKRRRLLGSHFGFLSHDIIVLDLMEALRSSAFCSSSVLRIFAYISAKHIDGVSFSSGSESTISFTLAPASVPMKYSSHDYESMMYINCDPCDLSDP
jgi:hypothetical protein